MCLIQWYYLVVDYRINFVWHVSKFSSFCNSHLVQQDSYLLDINILQLFLVLIMCLSLSYLVFNFLICFVKHRCCWWCSCWKDCCLWYDHRETSWSTCCPCESGGHGSDLENIVFLFYFVELIWLESFNARKQAWHLIYKLVLLEIQGEPR